MKNSVVHLHQLQDIVKVFCLLQLRCISAAYWLYSFRQGT